MSKEELLTKLKEYAEYGDVKFAHIKADKALLEFINNDEIEASWNAVEKWYA